MLAENLPPKKKGDPHNYACGREISPTKKMCLITPVWVFLLSFNTGGLPPRPFFLGTYCQCLILKGLCRKIAEIGFSWTTSFTSLKILARSPECLPTSCGLRCVFVCIARH